MNKFSNILIDFLPKTVVILLKMSLWRVSRLYQKLFKHQFTEFVPFFEPKKILAILWIDRRFVRNKKILWMAFIRREWMKCH